MSVQFRAAARRSVHPYERDAGIVAVSLELIGIITARRIGQVDDGWRAVLRLLSAVCSREFIVPESEDPLFRRFHDTVQRHVRRQYYPSHNDLLDGVSRLHTPDERTAAESTTPQIFFRTRVQLR